MPVSVRQHRTISTHGMQILSLNNTIESVDEEAENLRLPVPKGIPQSHWWFFMHGNYFRAAPTC